MIRTAFDRWLEPPDEVHLPGYDELDPLCPDCGCSASDHVPVHRIDPETGDDYEIVVCPEIIGHG
jgi:hypothetical protein